MDRPLVEVRILAAEVDQVDGVQVAGGDALRGRQPAELLRVLLGDAGNEPALWIADEYLDALGADGGGARHGLPHVPSRGDVGAGSHTLQLSGASLSWNHARTWLQGVRRTIWPATAAGVWRLRRAVRVR